MPIPTKRAVPEQPAFAAGATKEVKLQRGYLEEGVTIAISGDGNTTTAGTVKSRGSVLQEIRLVADRGEVLQAWKADDLVIEQEIYEQNGLGNQITPPASGAIGAFTFKSAHRISFREPFAGKMGDLTLMPTWRYESLVLQLIFGGYADLIGGAGVGTLGTVAVTITQNGVLDYPVPDEFGGDTMAFARALAKAVKSYDEIDVAGAKDRLPIEVPLTADIRSMVIRSFDASGNASDGIVERVSFLANNNTYINSEQDWASLRAENSRVFGVAMPAGTAVLESAEDKDITDIYEVTGYSKATLLVKTKAAGKLRIAYRKLAPGE